MTTIAVFGAYGHTGRFVLAELKERGLVPLALGRDEERLRGTGADHVVASVDDPISLDRALAGAAAVINCAGPFATTAAPLIEAALRAGIPYVDVAAEIEANADTFRQFADRSRTPVVPAMAFFGGLGDLLVTAALGDWPTADEAHVAYGLSSWHPTAGTLAAGAVSHERRAGKRVRFTHGRLEYYTRTDLPVVEWDFPEPLGNRTVLGDFAMADIVTVPSHLAIPEVRTYMTTEAAEDLAGGHEAGPGRPAETFTVDVRVRRGGEERRVTAQGRDIYAVSAPLAVEAVQRLLDGRARATGVASAGRMFDAGDFLRALAPHISHRLTSTR
ncbi:NAD(P)H-binding protein [Asanoa sp. NPDC050611]|uniref:NAD(P)H-binding protein n=1 Tax=Asanoa sp. NPDC050611 TaxID=3157098 RepID=UPI0034080D1E